MNSAPGNQSVHALEWDYAEALVLCVVPVGLLLLFGVVLPLILAGLGLSYLLAGALLPSSICLLVGGLGTRVCWDLRLIAIEQLQAFVRAQARLHMVPG